MRVLSALILASAVAACSTPKPVDVLTGEACWRCRQPISDARLAAEVMASNGVASKFRTIHCMSTWLGQQAAPPDGRIYVTDYATGKWLSAESAVYVHTVVNRKTMERDFLAFATAEAAAKAADGAPLVGWDTVLRAGREQPM
ncbi:MAG: nitrous oxide reductase accessory protein NosL [Acidobacteriota bacterium]